MSIQGEQKSRRIFYLDLARVIAVVSISLNHAVNFSYDNYGNQYTEFVMISPLATCIKSVAYVFSRIGVPLFLMITGALVLSKTMNNEHDLKRFYKHNVLSLLITTEIWFIIKYCFSNIYYVNGSVSWQGMTDGLYLLIKEMLFIEVIPFENTWYMPMILGLYTTIPIAIIARKNATNGMCKWLLIPFVLVFVHSMFIPALKAFFTLLIRTDTSMPLLSFEIYRTDAIFHNIAMYYIYVIIGYYISCGVFSEIKDSVVCCLAIFVFCVCCIYQFWAYSRPINYLIDYNFPAMPICGGLFFELIRRKAHLLNRISKPIEYISRAAFAVYFLHMIIMTVVNDCLSFDGWRMDQKMLFLEVSSLLISLLIIAPLSKVRILRKYLLLIK